MAEETEVVEVDESLMSAGDMIAQEIEKTSDAVQAEEAEDGETKEEGQEAGTESGEADPKGETKEEPEGTSRSYEAYSGDKESEDYAALDGLSFKFKANGEELSLSPEEMVREVQKKAGLASQVRTRTRERDETYKELGTTKEALAKSEGNGDLLLKVLQDPAAYEELKAKYLEAGGSPTPTGEPGTPEAAKGDNTGTTVEEQYMASGRTVVEDHLMPFSEELGEMYGADPKEIVQEIIGLAGESPQEFFTEEVLAEIVNVTIPQMLLDAGFTLQEGKMAPTFDASIITASDSGRGFGIQKKGSTPRGQTEQETVLEARIKELESKLDGKEGKSSGDPKGELDSVSDGPGETGGPELKSESGDLNLEGADSVADIMKRVHAYGE